jgi:hypothetical protein
MKTILVTVPAAHSDYTLVSLLRNVGEEIYRKFSRQGIAEIPDMDSALTELHIRVQATRHLGEVTAQLKKTLRREGLAELATITRLDGPGSAS